MRAKLLFQVCLYNEWNRIACKKVDELRKCIYFSFLPLLNPNAPSRNIYLDYVLTEIFFQVKWDSVGSIYSTLCWVHYCTAELKVRVLFTAVILFIYELCKCLDLFLLLHVHYLLKRRNVINFHQKQSLLHVHLLHQFALYLIRNH